MFYLPLYHRLRGERCVVIGAGTTALRKIRWLVRAEARVTVVAPAVDAHIEALADAGSLEVLRERYRDEHISDSTALVVCATNDEAVSQAAYATTATLGFDLSNSLLLSVGR